MKKINVNQLKAGVILTYAGMGISNLISLIYTPLMLNILGQSEYGLYQMAFSIVSYLGLLSFGFQNTYLRFYSRCRKNGDRHELARLNGMFISIFLAMSGAAFLGGIILVQNSAFLFSGETGEAELALARNLMKLMVFNIMLTFPCSVFESYVSAHEQYTFQKLLNIAQSVLNPLLSLPLLFLGFRSVGMVVVQTLLTAGKLGMNIWFSRKKLGMEFEFSGMQKSLLKEVGGFSFYIFLNMIVDQINWNVDKFIIGKISGTAAVAVYAVGAQLNQYYVNFSTAVSSVFLPRVNRMVSEGGKEKELSELLARVGRIQFLVLAYILGGFIILGRYFIRVWAGEGYRQAYGVTLLLICPVTIPLIQNLGIEIQRAMNKHRFRSVLYFFMALGNLAVSIGLTKRFGVTGAAAGTCAGLLLGNGLIMNLYNHRKVGLDMKYFWRQIAPLFPGFAAATILGAGAAARIQVDHAGKFIGAGVLYTILYCGLEWKLGMNGKEKALVKDSLDKAGRWLGMGRAECRERE